jgi:WD40 repeat protein
MFSPDRLASGSSDGIIILWDILAETCLFRFLGHRGSITDLSFLSLVPYADQTITRSAFDELISSSLDSLVKVWDLDEQCYIQTLANHAGDVSCSSVVKASSDINNHKNDADITIEAKSVG